MDYHYVLLTSLNVRACVRPNVNVNVKETIKET
jgi:hypothetical protein